VVTRSHAAKTKFLEWQERTFSFTHSRGGTGWLEWTQEADDIPAEPISPQLIRLMQQKRALLWVPRPSAATQATLRAKNAGLLRPSLQVLSDSRGHTPGDTTASPPGTASSILRLPELPLWRPPLSAVFSLSPHATRPTTAPEAPSLDALATEALQHTSSGRPHTAVHDDTSATAVVRTPSYVPRSHLPEPSRHYHSPTAITRSSVAAFFDIEPPAPTLWSTEVLDKAAPDGFSRFERYSVRRPRNPRRARSAKDWMKGYEHEDPAVYVPPKHIWYSDDRPPMSHASPPSAARAALSGSSPRRSTAGGLREPGQEAEASRPMSSAEKRKATLRQLTQHVEQQHPPPCVCAECRTVAKDKEGFKAVVGVCVSRVLVCAICMLGSIGEARAGLLTACMPLWWGN
jgi:hypothetical protein